MKRILLLLSFALLLIGCGEKEPKIGKLNTPAGVEATLNETSITVTWQEVTDAMLYVVRYGVKDELARFDSKPSPETTFVLNDIVPGTTYEFIVRAANNEAVSEFSQSVFVEVPVPEVDETDLYKPTVTNVREGLGWVNFTVDAYSTECSYVLFDGDREVATAEFMKANAEDGTEEYSVGGLDLDTEYSELKIARRITNMKDAKVPIPTLKTGRLYELTGHPSATHVAFEWDDVAGQLDWTFASKVDVDSRTYRIELATDAEFTNIIYSLYTVNNFKEGGSTYSSANWVGQSGNGNEPRTPNAAANTNALFAQLQPATTYYFRVRNAADETVPNYIKGGNINLNAKTGRSVWSPIISGTTAPAHVPAEGELLYQPFDDHALQHDHVISAAGVTPIKAGETAPKNYIKFPWDGEWGLYAPNGGYRYDELGFAVQTPFEGNGEAKLDGQNVYAMPTDNLPSMKGWWCTRVIYPCQGALKFCGSSAGKDFIMTPAFTEVADNTPITISCKAGAVHASSAPSRMHIQIYRAATKSLELIKTFDLPKSPFVLNPNPDSNGYHNYVELLTYSTDAVLNKGDYIMFECQTVSDPVIKRMVIDDIHVVRK